METVPPSPSPEEILPGLFRIEVPLPRSPLGSINAWAIPDTGRSLLVDTGMLRPECESALLGGLDALGIDPGSLDVLITHVHADHSGLAGVLAARGARILMGRREIALLAAFENKERFLEVLAREAASFGIPGEAVARVAHAHPGLRYSPDGYPPVEPVDPGAILEAGGYRFEAVATPGHTPGHLCLWDARRKLLLAGDHILGDITPNITSWPGVPDSLGDYLASLEAVRRLEPALALPGHRSPVTDPLARIAELERHHEARLAEVLEILDGEPMTVCEVASRMTWDIRAESWSDFPVAQKWFACGEAASHLDRLAALGLARASGEPPRWERSG